MVKDSLSNSPAKGPAKLIREIGADTAKLIHRNKYFELTELKVLAQLLLFLIPPSTN